MKYLFIHVGQTAGTSFRSFLTNNIKKHAFLYGKGGKNFDIDKNTLANNDLFTAHRIKYGFHNRFDDNVEYQYLALLRHPLERMLSAYNYAIKRGWVGKNETIIQYYNRCIHFKTIFIDYFHDMNMDEPIEKRKADSLKNLNDDRVLFGFVENYQGFIDLVCNKNRWSKKIEKVNMNGRKYNLTKDDIDYFTTQLYDDIDFYNQAKNIYNTKYKKKRD